MLITSAMTRAHETHSISMGSMNVVAMSCSFMSRSFNCLRQQNALNPGPALDMTQAEKGRVLKTHDTPTMCLSIYSII